MPKTPEMVERVARAMWDSAPGDHLMPWHDMPDAAFDVMRTRRAARVAIFTLREPSDMMLSAALRFVFPPDQTDGDTARALFQAMIDSALRDGGIDASLEDDSDG